MNGCEHVNRLKLRKVFDCCAAHLPRFPVKRDMKTKCTYFLFGHACPKKEIRNFVFISRLTGKCAAQKLKNFCSSSLWTCSHHMPILKSENKDSDFC